MSNKFIYPSHTAGDRTPYTYYLCWQYLGVHYYGRRTAKNCHPNDLWTTYFTSSQKVKELRFYAEPDIIEIRYIFNDVQKCCDTEVNVLKHMKAKTSDSWLNDSDGIRNHGDVTGTVLVTDGKKKFRVSSLDPRYISGDLISPTKNTIMIKTSTGKIKRIDKSELKLSDEIYSSAKDKVVIIENGEYKFIHTSSYNKEKHMTPSQNKATVIIDGVTQQIDKDIARKTVGIKYLTSDTVMVKDKNGKKTRISVYDETYLQGELVHISVGTVSVRDQNGNCFRVDKNDSRYLQGELKQVIKGTVLCKDSSGAYIRVSKEDPRYISGELKHFRQKISTS